MSLFCSRVFLNSDVNQYALIAFCSLVVTVGSLGDVEFKAAKYEIPEP